jgi:hypothetical protein
MGALEKREKGCGVCGKRRGETTFVTSRSYILPSGDMREFRMGEEYEVSELDGRFLLSYNVTDVNGHSRQVFEEVK